MFNNSLNTSACRIITFLFILTFIFSQAMVSGKGSVDSQEKKRAVAVRTDEPIHIDGDLTESAWIKAVTCLRFCHVQSFQWYSVSLQY